MATAGKFIVIEGIDGCGGETQTNLLSDFLNNKGKQVEKITFPQYDKPIGKLIDAFLYEKHELAPEVQVLVYFTEFVQDKEDMEKNLKSGKILISDRYFTSTLAYQGLRGIETEKMLQLSRMFNLPKPDLTILVKISAKTSIKRKSREKEGNIDRNEKDCEFLKNLAERYESLAENNVFCPWGIVDGEKSIEEVFNQIVSLMNKKLNI